MFDIGPSEILLICVIALIVVGPERLPGAVKTAGMWIGRFRRSFYKIKSEIERELNADEIKRQLYNESVLAELDEAKNATGFAAGGTPAFGYPSPIAVFIDPQLRRHDEVWSAAGTPTTVYRIPLTDLIVASGAVEVDLAET